MKFYSLPKVIIVFLTPLLIFLPLTSMASHREAYFGSDQQKFKTKKYYGGASIGNMALDITVGSQKASWDLSNLEVKSGRKFKENFSLESRVGFSDSDRRGDLEYQISLYTSLLGKYEAPSKYIVPYGLMGFTLGGERAKLYSGGGYYEATTNWFEFTYGVGLQVPFSPKNDFFIEYISYGENEENIQNTKIKAELSAVNIGLMIYFDGHNSEPDRSGETQDISPPVSTRERKKTQNEEDEETKTLPSISKKYNIGLMQWKTQDQIDFTPEKLKSEIASQHNVSVYEENQSIQNQLIENSLSKRQKELLLKRTGEDVLVIGTLEEVNSSLKGNLIILNNEGWKKHDITSKNMEYFIAKTNITIKENLN